MFCFIDNTIDPYFNLAAEEYLLKHYTEPIFRLWRNSPSVIIGKHQNALAEINNDYIREHNIPVVRRLSGGGAVYHDLGNINFTFIDSKPEESSYDMFKRFTTPIINALKIIGINAELSGRNDLLIDGKKFSGNAIVTHKGRVLQHGTLLFSSTKDNIVEALKAHPEKLKSKGVTSYLSRITNVSDHLPESVKENMTPESFMEFLKGYILSTSSDYILRTYSSQDLEEIEKLKKEKYSTYEWNYSQVANYDFTNKHKFKAGLIEVNLNVKQGLITGCKFYGDYFNFKPSEEIENAIIGVKHEINSIIGVLKSYDMQQYFGDGITDQDIASLMI
jgi:lipoate---protein ligase